MDPKSTQQLPGALWCRWTEKAAPGAKERWNLPTPGVCHHTRTDDGKILRGRSGSKLLIAEQRSVLTWIMFSQGKRSRQDVATNALSAAGIDIWQFRGEFLPWIFGKSAPAWASLFCGSSYISETLLRVEPEPAGEVLFPELCIQKLLSLIPERNEKHAAGPFPVLGRA